MIKVGIFGASGYMGGELLRILLEHSEVEVVWATSRKRNKIENFHRNLFGSNISLVDPKDVSVGACDIIFFALPTGIPMLMAQEILDKKIKVIDLGADFRLNDRTVWEDIYSTKHACWDLSQKAVYGIPELHRDEIKKTDIVANPGCFSSASILGLAPLIKAGAIDVEKIIIDGLSGTAGAGAELDNPIHHPEIGNNIIPYNVINHRHTYEIEQELSLLSPAVPIVHFTTYYTPITRGILCCIHVFPKLPTSRNELLNIYKNFYKEEKFVKIFDLPKEENASWQYKPYPWVSAVSGTNYCHIGLDYDQKRNRVVIFSVLDSIGKGGAHVAVQNMNILFGIDEHVGVSRYGLHPY